MRDARRRLSALFFVFAVLASPAEAFPWKKVAKAAAIWGAPTATSLLATKGGVDCRRRNGVEPCTVHYGEFRGMEIARGGFSFSMSAITWGCLKDTGWKGCYGIAGSTAAFNVYWFVHEEKIRRKENNIGLAEAAR